MLQQEIASSFLYYVLFLLTGLSDEGSNAAPNDDVVKIIKNHILEDCGYQSAVKSIIQNKTKAYNISNDPDWLQLALKPVNILLAGAKIEELSCADQQPNVTIFLKELHLYQHNVIRLNDVYSSVFNIGSKIAGKILSSVKDINAYISKMLGLSYASDVKRPEATKTTIKDNKTSTLSTKITTKTMQPNLWTYISEVLGLSYASKYTEDKPIVSTTVVPFVTGIADVKGTETGKTTVKDRITTARTKLISSTIQTNLLTTEKGIVIEQS